MSDGLRLLSAIVRNGSTTALRSLSADIFVGNKETNTFNFIRGHYRSYSELPDLQTIANETGTNLPRAPEPVDYYLDRLRDRALVNAITPVYNQLHDSMVSKDVETVRNLVSQMSEASRRHEPEQSLLSIGETSSDLLDRIVNSRGAGRTGVLTGWDTLDQETDGYQNGDLIIWAARPRLGKTHLLLHQAKAAWLSGASILISSTEMTLHQITSRYLAHYTGMDPDILRRNQVSYWGERKLRAASSEMSEAGNIFLHAAGMGGSVDSIDAVIQEVSPDIIFVDGVYLLKPAQIANRRWADRHQTIAYVVDDIKNMALRRNRPVVGTTQINRAGANAPTLETLGYTDSFSTHASVILSIHADISDSNPRPNYRLIDILKGREGESGRYAISYRMAPMDFGEIPIPDGIGSSGDSNREGRVESNRRRFGNAGADWTGGEGDA